MLRELVLPRLHGVHKSGGEFVARCPAHDDGRASLTVGAGTNQPVVFHCHAGCNSDDVIKALGFTWDDLLKPKEQRIQANEFVATYDYRDERGELLFQVCRRADKSFIQRRPDATKRSGWTWKLDDTRRVLYRLAEVIEAVRDEREVWIVEGEKDANTLAALGLVATCNPGGAGKWRPEYTEVLRGAIVTIVQDRDEPGRKHARQVYDALQGVVAEIRIVEAAEGKDATDHINASRGVHELVEVEPTSRPTGQPPITTEPRSATSTDPDDFWSARPVFEHIHRYARARLVAPWATLGAVLAQVIGNVPPFVQLPPTVGTYASLNLLIGLVGPSGSGKDAAQGVAREAVETPHVFTAPLGSGEGLGHMFMRRTKEGLEQVNTAAIVTVGEIDTLLALVKRQASTVEAQLRQAAMGERLGFFYVDETKRMIVPAHQYRLCLIAGIQPDRGKVLLAGSDGGTPQRFLWLPAIDPEAPDEIPGCPEPIKWRPPVWRSSDSRRYALPVCDEACQVIVRIRQAQRRGERDALDGHAALTRLKVAAALAILDGRTGVREDDWRLAGQVMAVSDATRGEVVRALREQDVKANRARAEAEADRNDLIEERRDEKAIQRVSRWIMRKLTTDWTSRSALRGGMAGRDKAYLDAALDALLVAGQVEVDKNEYHGAPGTRYRRAQ